MASPTAAANAYASLGRMLESGGGIGAGAGKASELGGGQSFGAVLKDAIGSVLDSGASPTPRPWRWHRANPM